MNVNVFLADNPEFKIVVVKFDSSPKAYHYKTTLPVEAGDNVVVDTPSNGLVVLEAVEVIPAIETDLTSMSKLKWIVSVVDLTHYEQCKSMEREVQSKLNVLKQKKAREELIQNMSEQLGEENIDGIRKLVRL